MESKFDDHPPTMLRRASTVYDTYEFQELKSNHESQDAPHPAGTARDDQSPEPHVIPYPLANRVGILVAASVLSWIVFYLMARAV